MPDQPKVDPNQAPRHVPWAFLYVRAWWGIRGGRCERWTRERNRRKSGVTMKSGRCDGMRRGNDAKSSPTGQARRERKDQKSETPDGSGDLENQRTRTHRLSTPAFLKHRMRTYHFLQTRTSWSLLIQREIGQVISTHDQLHTGEIDRKTTTIRMHGIGEVQRLIRTC